jgi:tetratricopeptide (TPR) repeat protein
MSSIASRFSLAQRVRQLSSRLSSRDAHSRGELSLYYRRACLAAAEERYDDALIFCSKALAIDGAHLPTRLLIGQIHDRGRNDMEAALECYGKVIALGGYSVENPYCIAAREAIDRMVRGKR